MPAHGQPHRQFPLIKEFVTFIKARERHRRVKEGLEGFCKTNPKDPIVAQYRFCNVRRNDDRVTKFVHDWAFSRWREHPDLWFALVVARLFNNEETLAELTPTVLPFSQTRMLAVLKGRKAAGRKNFNAAYIVSTNGVAMDKATYLVTRVLKPLWKHREFISGEVAEMRTLEAFVNLLMRYDGFKTFMAAQVAADLKYAFPNRWSDFHTFAASGPGSKRGLNRAMGRDKDHPISESEFRATLAVLRDAVNARTTGWEPITAQDIQNCLCEFDKYCRVAEGGAPKQLYKSKEK